MTTPLAVSQLPAYVRTLVPLIVAYLGSILAQLGFQVEDTDLAKLVGIVVAMVFYRTVRLLEANVDPRFGLLLGMARAPVYPAKSSV